MNEVNQLDVATLLADRTLLDTPECEELDAFIDTFDSKEGILIEVLHKAQSLFGYLPPPLQLHIARKLGLPGAEVYGVVSFYSFFTMKPPGKHVISVCMGTACFVRGADKVLQAFKDELGIESDETTPDGLFTIKDVRCIGACGLAPVVTVGDKVFGRITAEDVPGILKQYRDQA